MSKDKELDQLQDALITSTLTASSEAAEEMISIIMNTVVNMISGYILITNEDHELTPSDRIDLVVEEFRAHVTDATKINCLANDIKFGKKSEVNQKTFNEVMEMINDSSTT
jgi:hypothetical protein